MKRIFFILTLLAVILPASTHAAAETITDFKSTATLGADNVMHVHEVISLDFAGVPHHGINRDIPVIRRGSEGVFSYTFGLVQANEEVQTSREGDYMRLRLGSPDVTFSGRRDYVLDYTLTPMALQATDHDRVFINATGEHWTDPILHAEYSLTLPVPPSSTPVCYAGAAGSQEHNCTVDLSGTTITASTNQILEPGSGLSVDAEVPVKTFSTYLVAGEASSDKSSTLLGFAAIAFFALVFLTGPIVIIVLIVIFVVPRFNEGRKETKALRQMTIIAEYEPDDGLSPAAHQFLNGYPKRSLGGQSLSTYAPATILDLAVRGYLKLTQLEKSGIFHGADYAFTKLKADTAGLRPYEVSTLNLLFPNGGNESTLKELTKASIFGVSEQLTALQITLESIKVAVEAEMESQGIVGPAKSMQTRHLTDAGRVKWAQAQGFKLYLGVAEKDRLDFTDAPDKTPERFSKLLPYAVALGVEKDWAKQFEGIDLTAATTWYAGDMSSIADATFAAAFVSSFASSTTSSSSSDGFSGSSGGGSVGGGGGGGGGSSW